MEGDPDFDVALSFSGDHRNYVAEVAGGLRRRGYRVFYDQYLREELIGQELIGYLQNVYSNRSSVVVAFVSEQWVDKPWPSHERETALAHALLTAPRDVPFLLPLRFDDTPVPGLQPTVAYEDLRTLLPRERFWRQDSTYKAPLHTTEFLVRVFEGRDILPSLPPEDESTEEAEVVIRLAWVSDGEGFVSTGIIPLEELAERETEVFPGEVEAGGPIAGRYVLIPERLSAAISPNEPVPILLHHAYKPFEVSWVQTLSSPAEESAVADQVKQQVQAAVEDEISRGSASIGPTFTRAFVGPMGPAIHGMCVMARPAR